MEYMPGGLDFPGPAIYAGLSGHVIYTELNRPCTICRVVQVLYHTLGFTDPALNVWLYLPKTIQRGVQALHYTQGFVGHAVYVGL